ncbi:MAG: hypothetical protein ACKOC5_07905, partial [Chloroflexota bacterium]
PFPPDSQVIAPDGALADAPLDLQRLAETTNEALENAAGEAAQRAFNVGCAAGLTPAAVLLVAMGLVTGFSVIGSALVLVVTVIGMVAFANLAAALARANTLKRAYHEHIRPELARRLQQAGLQAADFNAAAFAALPPAAALLQFIDPPLPAETTPAAEHTAGEQEKAP